LHRLDWFWWLLYWSNFFRDWFLWFVHLLWRLWLGRRINLHLLVWLLRFHIIFRQLTWSSLILTCLLFLIPFLCCWFLRLLHRLLLLRVIQLLQLLPPCLCLLILLLLLQKQCFLLLLRNFDSFMCSHQVIQAKVFSAYFSLDVIISDCFNRH